MQSTDLLTVGEIARRSGFAESAVRYYEGLGLLAASRTSGGQRRFERSTLRRLAFIRAARNIGLSLDEVAAALDSLPAQRTPTRADWARLSRGWRQRLDDQIDALTALRDGLDSCIGCGCLSLDRCAISNPADSARADGPGAAYLPKRLRRDAAVLAASLIWELRSNVSCYDARYVALAEFLDCPLVTLDWRLANSPGPKCDFELPDAAP
jgi:MerR family transcriptional regulator, redox-sensitive transcriptional activator SoxR